MNSRLFF